MIRPLSLFFLLGASAIVFAQPLYKWVEPDGAITFSVTKPPAGVSYETVNPADSQSNAPTTRTPSSDVVTERQKITPDSTKPMQGAALPPSTRTNQTAERIAPKVGSPANTNSISRSADTSGTAMTTANAKVQTGDQTAAINARTRKQRQCEDLQKRVVSLERRLKTRLTPEDMDNTVVHMARYQRSFDQHCVQ